MGLAYLLGVMLGDGGIYGKSYTVFCRDREKKFAEDIARIVEELFHIKPRVRKISPNCWMVSTNHRKVHKFFERLQYPKGRKLVTLDIPSMFLQDKLKVEVVQGLFDAEGYCGLDIQRHGEKTYVYPYVGIDMIAKPLIKRVQGILGGLGIESSVNVKRLRAWGKNPQFSLVIKGMERVKKFKELIGFRHPEKAKKLKRLVEGGSSETIRQAHLRCDDMVHPSAREGGLR